MIELLFWFLFVTQIDLHFMKKIPPGAEASNVLVGELDFLDRPVVAFIRLAPAVLLNGLAEVPITTRLETIRLLRHPCSYLFPTLCSVPGYIVLNQDMTLTNNGCSLFEQVSFHPARPSGKRSTVS